MKKKLALLIKQLSYFFLETAFNEIHLSDYKPKSIIEYSYPRNVLWLISEEVHNGYDENIIIIKIKYIKKFWKNI